MDDDLEELTPLYTAAKKALAAVRAEAESDDIKGMDPAMAMRLLAERAKDSRTLEAMAIEIRYRAERMEKQLEKQLEKQQLLRKSKRKIDPTALGLAPPRDEPDTRPRAVRPAFTFPCNADKSPISQHGFKDQFRGVWNAQCSVGWCANRRAQWVRCSGYRSRRLRLVRAALRGDTGDAKAVTSNTSSTGLPPCRRQRCSTTRSVSDVHVREEVGSDLVAASWIRGG